MADEVDKKAFDAMQKAVGPKTDEFFKGDDYKEFDWGTFYEKGDSLYSVYADKSIPQYDPNYPGISMFDESGQETPEYKQAFVDAGIKRTTSVIGQTPRQAYFRGKFSELEEGMDPGEAGDLSTRIKIPYGFMEPKYYQNGKLVSPYKSAEIYYDMTKDMDWKERIRFDRDVYKPFVKGLTTKK